jgi:hypothetical protein
MNSQLHVITQSLLNISLSERSRLIPGPIYLLPSTSVKLVPPPTSNIELSVAAPKHEEQNHTSEKNLYSLHTIAVDMLVRARLLPEFTYHSIRYAIEVFAVIPVKKLLNKTGESTHCSWVGTHLYQ